MGIARRLMVWSIAAGASREQAKSAMTRRSTAHIAAGPAALLPAVLLLAALLLAGCGPSRTERIAAQNAEDHAHCLDLGFEEGTEAYGNCRLKLREIRAGEAADRSNTRFGVGIGVGIGL